MIRRTGLLVLGVLVALAACSSDPEGATMTEPVRLDAGEDGEDVAADAPPAEDADEGGEDAALPDAPLEGYPRYEHLAPMEAPPPLLRSFDGSREVDGVEAWEGWRRAELKELLAFYIYGYVPAQPVEVGVEVVQVVEDFVPGAVRYEELELSLSGLPLRLHVALFTPHGVEAPPVFIAPNKCGNQEVHADPSIRLTEAWIDATCGAAVEETRGVRAASWPVEEIVGRGYAFATFHESEVDPDTSADTTFSDGVHPLLVDPARPAEERWGRIAAWAWGISRVLDGLEVHGGVDLTRVAAVGHSRRGKTALLAGATDERIGLVIAHQSGTAGTSLTRSMQGETVWAINAFFPAWFNDIFPTFSDDPLRLPVDQHMLIALVAPRLVLATDGDEDSWADPGGSRLAVELAAPAWGLYGAPGLIVGDDGLPSLEGRLSWRLRPGGHALETSDWTIFLEFADGHWGDR